VSSAVEIEIVAPSGGAQDLERAAETTLGILGVADGHLAVTLVVEEEIVRLNRDHRAKDEPTDVLSFPIDGTGHASGPRELGDIVICPAHAADLEEAVVHGVLHLCGHDHETDRGEMLTLQQAALARLRG
jgi:probable rRNA maturation factor